MHANAAMMMPTVSGISPFAAAASVVYTIKYETAMITNR